MANGETAGTVRRSIALVSRLWTRCDSSRPGRRSGPGRARRRVEGGPAETVAVGVVRGGDEIAAHGPREHVFRWASVTKLATALAALVAAEEVCVDRAARAGPRGSTVRHLLSHASGLPLDGSVPISKPGERPIYSNYGFEA